MSTNYFPYCVDCQSGHHIESDRMCDESRALIRIAPALAAFADAWAELSKTSYSIQMGFPNGGRSLDCIDPMWFKVHASHHLVVRNEYGDNDDECGTDYQCEGCRHLHRVKCRRTMKHEGDHGDSRDDGKP